MQLHWLLVTILLLDLAGSTVASPLRSLLDQYQEQSPSLQAEAARVLSVKEAATGANAFPAPTLGVEWGQKAQNPGMSNATMYYGGLNATQEFMFPGKRASMQQAEAERSKMAEADFLSAKLNGQFRIAQVYVELYMVQQRKEILDSNLSILSNLIESARRRFETGMAGMEGIYRLQAEASRLRSDSLALLGEERALKSMLAATLGQNTPAEVPTKISFADNTTNPELDSLLFIAQTRPELGAMNAGTRMAAKESEVAATRKLPDLMVQGRYMTMMGPDEWSLMLGVKIPIAPWASSQNQAMEKASQAKVNEAKSRAALMKVMLEGEVREAWERLQTAKLGLQQIQQNQIPATQNAVQSALTTYANGNNDLSMVIDAVRMLLMAQDDLVMAKVKLVNSTLNLEKAAGISPGTWIAETTETIP